MKKLLSVLLSLALVACMMPSMVYAGSGNLFNETFNVRNQTLEVTVDSGYKATVTSSKNLVDVFSNLSDFGSVEVNGKVDGLDCGLFTVTKSSNTTITATPSGDSPYRATAWGKLTDAIDVSDTTNDSLVQAYSISNENGSVVLNLPRGAYAYRGKRVFLNNAISIRVGLTFNNNELPEGISLTALVDFVNVAIGKAKEATSPITVDVEIVPNPVGPVTPPSNTETTVTEETDKDGNKITTETTVNKDTGAVTEKVETVKPDGSKSEVTTETKTDTKTDGTEVKTENKVTVETDKDGNKTETKVETEDITRPDGTQTTTTTTTAADKSVEIVETDKDVNNFDNKVVTETTTTISSGGVVTNVEQTISIGTKIVGPISVDVKMDNEGAVEEAVAEYTRTGANAAGGVKTLLNGNHLSQVVNAVGADAESITVKATINNASGKKAYTVTANAADLTKGNKLYVLAVDKNGKQVLVNAESYAVTKNGSVNVTLPSGMDYQLVTKTEKDAAVKAIKATIAPTATKKSVTKGKTSTMSLKKTLNKANVSKITYSTSSKSVATVSKTGKITAKKKGTVTIKATVTLKDGSKKTVSTKITVK